MSRSHSSALDGFTKRFNASLDATFRGMTLKSIVPRRHKDKPAEYARSILSFDNLFLSSLMFEQLRITLNAMHTDQTVGADQAMDQVGLVVRREFPNHPLRPEWERFDDGAAATVAHPPPASASLLRTNA